MALMVNFFYVRGGSMYEQIAKDQVQERLEQGVSSQQTHHIIAQQRKFLSLDRRIVSCFSLYSIFKRIKSQIDFVHENGRVSLNSVDEPS
jgi:hypothetical protein